MNTHETMIKNKNLERDPWLTKPLIIDGPLGMCVKWALCCIVAVHITFLFFVLLFAVRLFWGGMPGDEWFWNTVISLGAKNVLIASIFSMFVCAIASGAIIVYIAYNPSRRSNALVILAYTLLGLVCVLGALSGTLTAKL